MKRKAPADDENKIIVKAIRECVVSALVEEDIEPFNEILKSVFPGTNIPDEEDGDLETTIKLTMNNLNLMYNPY